MVELRFNLDTLDRMYLSGNEDCAVDLGCLDCDRRGLPIAYYARYDKAYADNADVVKVDSIAGLVLAAHEHVSTHQR